MDVMNLTVAQVYISILMDRGFNQTEIARLSGIHRVTISNIANFYYSGATSEKKIKAIMDNLQLTNSEKQLIHKAMYHVPIAIQNTPTPVSVTPANTPVIHEINQSNVSEIINKYANSNGTCMFCQKYIKNNCTAAYYNGDFIIMCLECSKMHKAKLSPIPQH